MRSGSSRVLANLGKTPFLVCGFYSQTRSRRVKQTPSFRSGQVFLSTHYHKRIRTRKVIHFLYPMKQRLCKLNICFNWYFLQFSRMFSDSLKGRRRLTQSKWHHHTQPQFITICFFFNILWADLYTITFPLIFVKLLIKYR